MQCVPKTFEETGQVEDKRGSVRPKKLSTADQQYLKVKKKSSKDLTKVKISLSIYCSLKPHQKWSPWKGGCQEAILKEGKRGEKAELCQMTKEVD